MGEKTFGIGIIGLGMGHECGKWVRSSPNCKVACVCDVDDAKIKRSVDEFQCDGEKSYDAMLDRKDVDIVYIVTPSGTHADLGVKAAQKGKHVCVAKPMDVSLENCDRLIEACVKNKVLCTVDFNNRLSDLQQHIRYAIENKLLGRLLLGEARLKWYRSNQYYAAGGWRGTWKMDGGGSLANQAIHQIDQLVWHMGPVEKVIAAEVGVFAHENVETEDMGLALLKFKSGAMGTILGTTTFPKDHYAGLEIHGTEGAVIAITKEPTWLFHEADRKEKLQRVTPMKTMVENMAAVLNGTCDALVCDGHEGRKSIELLTAVYRSAREKREVKL